MKLLKVPPLPRGLLALPTFREIDDNRISHYQAITFHPSYQDRSFEEIRLADYAKGHHYRHAIDDLATLLLQDLELVEFFGNNIPPYAILSHTWGEDEVLYEDIFSKKAGAKRGIRKVLFTLWQAHVDGLDYAWVDSCCIDKKSSAELQEAINSMFQFYKDATVCYAYLEDVTTVPRDDEDYAGWEGLNDFSNSRWFTRGWTLQELLAPSPVVFYSKYWAPLGWKGPQTCTFLALGSIRLNEIISRITGIATTYLEDPRQLQRASIATRMSWQSARTCTRVEDLAYSLLGIFDVNMPLLYGEGRKAFSRLQEQIIRQSDDTSIFRWVAPHPAIDANSISGVFAATPAWFTGCNIVETRPPPGQLHTVPYALTNKGLSIELGLIPLAEGEPDLFLGVLDCGDCGSMATQNAIILRRLTPGTDQFERLDACRIESINGAKAAIPTSIFLRSTATSELQARLDFISHLHCKAIADTVQNYKLLNASGQLKQISERIEQSSWNLTWPFEENPWESSTAGPAIGSEATVTIVLKHSSSTNKVSILLLSRRGSIRVKVGLIVEPHTAMCTHSVTLTPTQCGFVLQRIDGGEHPRRLRSSTWDFKQYCPMQRHLSMTLSVTSKPTQHMSDRLAEYHDYASLPKRYLHRGEEVTLTVPPIKPGTHGSREHAKRFKVEQI